MGPTLPFSMSWQRGYFTVVDVNVVDVSAVAVVHDVTGQNVLAVMASLGRLAMDLRSIRTRLMRIMVSGCRSGP